MTNMSPDTQETLEFLRQVAADTLERKRRLGTMPLFGATANLLLLGKTHQTI